MNWNETLIRASSVGYLMTEPVTKADKEAGVLSKTAQKHLLDVYISEKYNRRRDIQTKQMKKGVEVEQESIDLLSMYLKKPFVKNTERFSNKHITGLPDIIDDGIIDIKSSYDLWTFLGNIPDKLDNLYYWQMQSYMWLTGKTKATIAYCLVNTPNNIIQQEKYYLLKKMADNKLDENNTRLKDWAKDWLVGYNIGKANLSALMLVSMPKNINAFYEGYMFIIKEENTRHQR